MYIYNITSNVDRSVHEAWIAWVKEIYIPKVLSSGYFTHHQLLVLLDAQEEEGVTFALQFTTDSLEKYQSFLEQFADSLRKLVFQKWGDQLISFSTVMQVL
jgi:hypothetical protein